jgi:hypothetical protein
MDHALPVTDVGNIVRPEIIRIKSFHGTPKTSLRKRSFTRFFLKSVHCRAGTAVAQSIYHDQVHAGVAYFLYNEVLVQGLMCLYLLIASVYFALTTYGPVVCRLVFRAERRARAPESVIAVNIFHYPWPFQYHRSRQPSIRSLSTALRLDALQNLHPTQVPIAHAKEVE